MTTNALESFRPITPASDERSLKRQRTNDLERSCSDCALCRFDSISRSSGSLGSRSNSSTPSTSSAAPSSSSASPISSSEEDQKAVKEGPVSDASTILSVIRRSLQDVSQAMQTGKTQAGLKLVDRSLKTIAHTIETSKDTQSKYFMIQLYLMQSYAFIYKARLVHDENNLFEEGFINTDCSTHLNNASRSIEQLTRLKKSRMPIRVGRRAMTELALAIDVAKINLKNLSENISAEIHFL